MKGQGTFCCTWWCSRTGTLRAGVVGGPTGTVGSCHTALALCTCCSNLLWHPPLALRGEKPHCLHHQDVRLKKLLTWCSHHWGGDSAQLWHDSHWHNL